MNFYDWFIILVAIPFSVVGLFGVVSLIGFAAYDIWEFYHDD